MVVEVGINEGMMRASNPHVPYIPEEIAYDARACYEAGAAVVHYHGRDAETGAGLITDHAVNIATQRRITETSPVITYPTYGSSTRVLDHYDIVEPAHLRYRHFIAGVDAGVRFEVGPVNLGAAFDVNARRNPDDGRLVPTTGYQINSGAGHEWLLNFCRENAMKPIFAVFDNGHIRNLVEMGWVTDQPLAVKLFFGPVLPPTAKTLVYVVDQLHDIFAGYDLSWTTVVMGADQFPLCAMTLVMCGHVRVGLGDYAYQDEGQPSNPQLVERVLTIARALGREPASPDDTRALRGITGATH